MTFQVLNETTLLVEMSYEDMKKHKITYETLDHNSSAIKKILKIVKAGDNFNTSEKITIEALPIDNGCFFIFTFLPKKTRYKMRKLHESVLFKTENLDDLLDFVSVIKEQYQKNLKYEIYKMNNAFYMKIPESNNKINAMMGEYGCASNTNFEKISEYGMLLGSITI